MNTRFIQITRKRYGMINAVSFKVIARTHTAGQVSLNAQCFVNKQRVVIPLSIYIEDNYFDSKAQLVKVQHPSAIDYNAIIANARERVSKILAEANKNDVRLDRDGFRARFTFTLSDIDFVKFWEDELEARRGGIDKSTLKQHKASLRKFKQFRQTLPFDMLSPALIDSYETFLKRKGNGINTVALAMKNFKAYLNRAEMHGIEFKNPFKRYRIVQTQGRITYLTVEEQQKLISMYNEHALPVNLHESLLVFLVQCFTSIRISDAIQITQAWIQHGDLEFMPYKTRRYKKFVKFPLTTIGRRLLTDLFALKRSKKLKAESTINDDLKIIAATAGIHKNVSTHVARHTFATTYIYLGGKVETLQQIMGHSRIETTMRYVKILDGSIRQEMGNFDTVFK